MAELEHAAPASPSSSPSPSCSTSQDPARDGIPEDQLCPAGALAWADTAHTGTITLPSNSGGGAPSVLPLVPLGSPSGIDEEGTASTVGMVSLSDPFPGQTPTLDAADPSRVADPASGSSDTLLKLGPEEGSETAAILASTPSHPHPLSSSIVSPSLPTPALPGPHPVRVQTSPPGPENAGPSTAQVSLVAADQPAGGFSAAVSISFNGAHTEPVQMSGALVPGEAKNRMADPSREEPSPSSVAWADEQVVLSEKQKGKQPVQGLDPTDKALGPLPPPPSKMPLHVWKKVAGRPPQKLPIRFKDAMGRNHLWPWKVAKTWKGAKRLIDAAFKHVHIIGDHVLAGHYDLFIHHAWEEPQPESRQGEVSLCEATEASTSYSAPAPAPKEIKPAAAVISPIVVADQEPVDAEPGTQSTAVENQEDAEDVPVEEQTTPSWSPTISSSSSFFTASPPPSPPLASTMPSFPSPPPPPPHTSPIPSGPPGAVGVLDLNHHGVFLLPELWDDVVEPGMYISMHIWPFPNNPTTAYPMAPPLSSPYPPPPPWPPGPGPGPGAGRGRARGRGSPGRGTHPGAHMGGLPPGPSGPAGSMPVGPPGWGGRRPPIQIHIPRPKGKTRKRQDGL